MVKENEGYWAKKAKGVWIGWGGLGSMECGPKGGSMAFFKRQHVLFSLAYSLTVFAGLNLAAYTRVQ